MSTALSSADAAWLRMDQPNNLMVITSVMLFDEPVDWPRFREVIETRLVDAFPRFRQRVETGRRRLITTPRWVDDEDFALEHHLHHRALPVPGDDRALQDLIADLMATPLDRRRPLWQGYLVDGYGQGAAAITRMHHCIADGIVLAGVLSALTDEVPSPEAHRPRRFTATSSVPSGEGEAPEAHRTSGLPAPVEGLLRSGRALLRGSAHLMTSPVEDLRRAGQLAEDAVTAARLLLETPDAPSLLKREPHLSRAVCWSQPLPLGSIRRAAHTRGVTVNDIILAAVAGSLREFLIAWGAPISEIKAMVPFNVRGPQDGVPQELGNRFGLVYLPLPLQSSTAEARVDNVHREMSLIKAHREGPVSYAVLSLTGLAPEPVERRLVNFFTSKATAVMTNVRGPREPVFLAGAPVRSVLIWAPTSGHLGMSVSVFSYRDEVTVGLMVDAALSVDAPEIVAGIEREISQLAQASAPHTEEAS